MPTSKLLAMKRRTMFSLTLNYKTFMSGPYLLIERASWQVNACSMVVPKGNTVLPQLGQSCFPGLPCWLNQAGLRKAEPEAR